eukprot:3919843-Karenia_brevis.AAC.1
MRCKSRGVSPDVISFIAAISVCGKGEQWRCVAPLLNEMQNSGWVTRCDQFQRSHLSFQEGWAVAACGAIVR